MSTIKEYQEKQIETHYKMAKELILYDIKQRINSDPFIDSVIYTQEYQFRAPLSMMRKHEIEIVHPYSLIKKYFKTIADDLLKEEEIVLKQIVEYEQINRGIFKKQIFQEYSHDYYLLKW